MTQNGFQAETDVAEARLLVLLAQGNEEAFGLLYGRYQSAVYRFAMRMSGSAAVADDVVQEVFLALIRGKHTYRHEAGGLRPYLLGVARNIVRHAVKDVTDQAIDDGITVDTSDPLADLERGERTGRVRQAVLSLPLHYREAVVLCDLEEMSYEEASRALGCALGTVRSRVSRGRELLLTRLQEARCMI